MRTMLIVGLGLIVALGVLSSALVAEARTWTDNTGTYHLDAELVSLADGKVRLQGPSGQVYSIPLARLSSADRKVIAELDRNLQPTADSTVPQTLTAAIQLGASGNSSTGAGSPMRQNPAPLPLDAAPLGGQIPATQDAQLPQSEAGGQQPAISSKDKRIFSGCLSTFQLHGRDGTGAYWIDGKHYLAKLSYSKTEGDFVLFTGSGEGGVQFWAFYDVASCGPSRVYAWMNGSRAWRLFDFDYRELPD